MLAKPQIPALSDERTDLQLIAELVAPDTRVLDIGCGDGALLKHLQTRKNVDARGIELSQAGVNRCVSAGLSVIQGDADTDLKEYPAQSFDYTVLSQTIQATRKPHMVLSELLRIGKRAIVSLPNFGHWTVRKNLMFRGEMPVSEHLPYTWYETPNIHFCTIADFHGLCRTQFVEIERMISFGRNGQQLPSSKPLWFHNFFGTEAVFVLKKAG